MDSILIKRLNEGALPASSLSSKAEILCCIEGNPDTICSDDLY